MEHGPGELGILYRILLLLPEQEHLQRLTGELAAYYQRIIPELEAAKWLAKAGIPYPDSFEWSVSFRFTSNGEPFFVSGDEADKNKWFSLSVELFGRVLSMEIIQGSQAIRFVYITLTNSFTGYGMKSMAIFCTTINI